jgi:hypothetical protein
MEPEAFERKTKPPAKAGLLFSPQDIAISRWKLALSA